MPEDFPYEDIVSLPHPTSRTHPRMPALNRAAQFAPFAALSGYGDAIDEAARLVAETFKAKIAQYGLKPPRLGMEPARYFVGDAGWLIGTVHAIKDSYTRIVGTDISMNTLARPAMYGAYHHIYVNGREDEPRKPVGLCGQVCENTDYWVKERPLPERISVGDLVVVENAGAYGYGMSYPYNGRLRPAEVLVNGKEHWLIRDREVFEDMIRNVHVPPHLQA